MGWSLAVMGAIAVQGGLLGAIAFALPAYAQTSPMPMPALEPSVSTEAEALQNQSTAVEAVELTLPDLINIVIQGNRDLKNAVLERVVQRQVLEQEESRFDPQFTPDFSLQVDRDLSSSPPSSNGARSDDNFATVGLDDRTTLNQSLQVSSTLRTRLGTELSIGVDPIDDAGRVNLTVTQPLLRGAGRAVNEAPVRQARIAESNNVLALRQEVIDTITTSITQYTTLIQSQEAVDIQVQALERRRQQFEIIQALVEAGRRARVDLIDAERTIAEAELGLQNARNQLSQANTDLLNLIGSDTMIQFVAPEAALDQLFAASVRQAAEFNLDQLIGLAYQIRPDYLQAQSNLELEDLGLLLAEDNRRWRLDLESTTRLGNASPRTGAVLQLTRTFGDESLETAVQRSRTNILQQQNTLAQLTETIRNEITDQLGDVDSELAQVESAQRATEAAELQLQITQEKFRRGRDGVSLFDVSQREEDLVNAQNAELQARISFFNSIAELERSVGITLDTWRPLVDLSPILAEEDEGG
ncbi:MAG: TolC family protein [Leptolyngbyaceae cyanobacterium MO_188.B28]|nr:TolC family protein [Leptolyngbyaceae cyanobacterium MO_188.B28]